MCVLVELIIDQMYTSILLLMVSKGCEIDLEAFTIISGEHENL